MQFRTEIKCDHAPAKITLKSSVLTAGSCFADAMGERLHANKFKVCANPFGNIYNPVSLHNLLEAAAHHTPWDEDSFVRRGNLWLNYNFHSSFSDPSLQNLKARLDQIGGSVHQVLKDAGWIIITYGTSWVYERKDTKMLVANCHKIPLSNFTKRLLTEDEILTSFAQMRTALHQVNPSAKIIVTVSPVRHLKDTLPLNNVSKSLLRLACHKLSEAYENVDYFPSFEIMTDDLRDYRFYKSDLIHPTTDAEDYIWEKFADAYFDEPTTSFLSAWRQITTSLKHKPFHPEAEDHQQFLKSTLKKLEDLQTVVDVSSEMQRIKQQLH